jgi:PRC-barrel domain
VIGGSHGLRRTRDRNLIGSDKVEGTAVYGSDKQQIGSIERVMIDKITGKVAYAVLGFGCFLGIGDDHYPLPWQSLKYDTSLDGYVVVREERF